MNIYPALSITSRERSLGENFGVKCKPRKFYIREASTTALISLIITVQQQTQRHKNALIFGAERFTVQSCSLPHEFLPVLPSHLILGLPADFPQPTSCIPHWRSMLSRF